MNVAELMAARDNAVPKPSWCSIFTKAFAKVVASRPHLRRAYLTFPWERLYEYSAVSVTIILQTEVRGESAAVSVILKDPEDKPLVEIDRYLDSCREDPLKSQIRYRRMYYFSFLPRFLRRPLWWYHLNASAYQRSRNLGTFGVSSMAKWGVDSLRPISPCTTVLHYGVVDGDGNVAMRLTFDHRVLDGKEPSMALADLEKILRSEILAEVQSLRGTR